MHDFIKFCKQGSSPSLFVETVAPLLAHIQPSALLAEKQLLRPWKEGVQHHLFSLHSVLKPFTGLRKMQEKSVLKTPANPSAVHISIHLGSSWKDWDPPEGSKICKIFSSRRYISDVVQKISGQLCFGTNEGNLDHLDMHRIQFIH